MDGGRGRALRALCAFYAVAAAQEEAVIAWLG